MRQVGGEAACWPDVLPEAWCRQHPVRAVVREGASSPVLQREASGDEHRHPASAAALAAAWFADAEGAESTLPPEAGEVPMCRVGEEAEPTFPVAAAAGLSLPVHVWPAAGEGSRTEPTPPAVLH